MLKGVCVYMGFLVLSKTTAFESVDAEWMMGKEEKDRKINFKQRQKKEDGKVKLESSVQWEQCECLRERERESFAFDFALNFLHFSFIILPKSSPPISLSLHFHSF